MLASTSASSPSSAIATRAAAAASSARSAQPASAAAPSRSAGSIACPVIVQGEDAGPAARRQRCPVLIGIPARAGSGGRRAALRQAPRDARCRGHDENRKERALLDLEVGVLDDLGPALDL